MQGLIIFAVAFLAITGCALFGPAERAELSGTMNALEQCQEAARQAPDGGHLKAYENCKKDAGL